MVLRLVAGMESVSMALSATVSRATQAMPASLELVCLSVPAMVSAETVFVLAAKAILGLIVRLQLLPSLHERFI